PTSNAASKALSRLECAIADLVGIILSKARGPRKILAPRFRAWRQNHSVAVAVDQNFVAGKAIFLGNTHRLAAPGHENLCGSSPARLLSHIPLIYSTNGRTKSGRFGSGLAATVADGGKMSLPGSISALKKTSTVAARPVMALIQPHTEGPGR